MSDVKGSLQGECLRLQEDRVRTRNWKRWGTYLAERQWGTVREDYSPDGSAWSSFTHEHARSRAYRWGEDGLLGLCDRECRLCFAPALWNGKDRILKERLFGLTGPQGNHGEDVKECYFYLDATPTCSYAKALYKYPQAAFPYEHLIEENRRRSLRDPEFELLDTGVFAHDRYFDVWVEYAKNAPDDVLLRITIVNHGPAAAPLVVLPTLWFRNTWSWGCTHEGCTLRPLIWQARDGLLNTRHDTLEPFCFAYAADPLSDTLPALLCTENETNFAVLFDAENEGPYVKDAFHRYVVEQQYHAVNPQQRGTKIAPLYALVVPPAMPVVLKFRLAAAARAPVAWFGADFDAAFALRIKEADDFYAGVIPAATAADARVVARQAYAGLLWSKQFYHYVVSDWLTGDPNYPPPSAARAQIRNFEWRHVFNRDVLSMPDTWEYPWFAAWDLAFHMIPFSRLDPDFAEQQLTLLLREWYMHPSGQLPAYEYNFADVNPPVQAWAAWRVYKMSAPRGARNRAFLERVYQKLLLNFTWWVNRKDAEGHGLFAGGFLGMDNIGVFDRSRPLPTGGVLEQADGTAWMAFYCLTMLAISLELARDNRVYEDLASKFFEHFIAIADAMNCLGGYGLWDDHDGFYYDRLKRGDESMPLRTRSMVGLIPLIAVEVLDDATLLQFPGFTKRMHWFLENRKDLAAQVSFCDASGRAGGGQRLLALCSRPRLERVLRYLLAEDEFLSPHGIRSLSRVHHAQPYVFSLDGNSFSVSYEPGEGHTKAFGGNSNWRGPVWFPINYLLIEALERFHRFYGDTLRIECPIGSGRLMNLKQVATELSRRLAGIFMPDAHGHRACHGACSQYATDPHWKNLVLFHEYFHGDTGRGLGASHQTGWTGLVAKLIEKLQ